LKNTLLILFLLTICSCTSKEDDCKALYSRQGVACTEEYAPVGGCNNRTYSNSCKANAWGIEDFSVGECRSNGRGVGIKS